MTEVVRVEKEPEKTEVLCWPPMSASVYSSCMERPSAEKLSVPRSSFRITGFPKNSRVSFATAPPSAANE
eukprot:scaffold148_cov78-Phaeocystis_antarctica.AAC.7